MVEGDEGDRGSFAVGISYRDGRRLRYGLGLAVLWVLVSFGARRFPKGERKALWCARRRIPLAPRGIDAPTTARMVGLPPRGGKYFLSARKKVPKKARGTATTKTAHVAARRGLRPAVAPSGLSSASARCAHPPEKGFYCPFCQRDSQRRARHSWRVISCSRARSCARLFPPSKWAGLFPFAAYRRSAPPQLALGRLK